MDSKALHFEKMEFEMSMGCPVAVGFGIQQKVWEEGMALGIILGIAMGLGKGHCVKYKRGSGCT